MHDFAILNLVAATVAEAGGLRSPKQLYDMRRHPTLAKLRDTTLFLIRAKTQLSYEEIGRAFRRDRSTIICAVKREEERLRRVLPLRPDGRTLQQWHEFLSKKIDEAVAASVAQS